MISANQPTPAWHTAARLKLSRLQAEANGANEQSKAFSDEANQHNARLNNDLRPMLQKATDARALIKQARIPDSDQRAVQAQAAIDAIRVEVEATAQALEDARLRYSTAHALSAARLRLAWDAKQVLRTVGVEGVQ